MTVTDLREGEASGIAAYRTWRLADCFRAEHSSRNSPNYPGSCPCHALQEPTAVNSISIYVLADSTNHLSLSSTCHTASHTKIFPGCAVFKRAGIFPWMRRYCYVWASLFSRLVIGSRQC